MINHERLMLTIPHADMLLIRQLILNSKAALAPIELRPAEGAGERHASVNLRYLDVIALDRATLASAAVLQALPENERAVIYLSYQEFKTILALLEDAAVSADPIARECQILWEQLDIAQLYFDSCCREQPGLDSAD